MWWVVMVGASSLHCQYHPITSSHLQTELIQHVDRMAADSTTQPPETDRHVALVSVASHTLVSHHRDTPTPPRVPVQQRARPHLVVPVVPPRKLRPKPVTKPLPMTGKPYPLVYLYHIPC